MRAPRASQLHTARSATQSGAKSGARGEESRRAFAATANLRGGYDRRRADRDREPVRGDREREHEGSTASWIAKRAGRAISSYA